MEDQAIAKTTAPVAETAPVETVAAPATSGSTPETRSAAALKAVETRRQAGTLSASARKAWETRRANGWVHPLTAQKQAAAAAAEPAA